MKEFEALPEDERLEVARHIVAQGEEAGFIPAEIELAQSYITAQEQGDA